MNPVNFSIFKAAYPITIVFTRDEHGKIIDKKQPLFGVEDNYYKSCFEKNNNRHLNIVNASSKNFAILVGKHFNLTLLDIDEGHGKNGIQIFEENVCKIDTLDTLVTQTARGGRHIYIPYNARFKTTNNKKLFFDVKNSSVTPYINEKRRWMGITLAFEGHEYNVINDRPIKDLEPEISDKIFNTYYTNRHAPNVNEEPEEPELNDETPKDSDFQPINAEDFIAFENSPFFCDALERQPFEVPTKVFNC